MLHKWCIFYDDGTTFTDSDGEPEDARGDGVVCIACQASACTVHKFDWYYYADDIGHWWGSDIHGLVYQLTRYPRRVRAVKQGANVTNEVLQRCMSLALRTRQ